jgi:hypothetical protein
MSQRKTGALCRGKGYLVEAPTYALVAVVVILAVLRLSTGSRLRKANAKFQKLARDSECKLSRTEESDSPLNGPRFLSASEDHLTERRPHRRWPVRAVVDFRNLTQASPVEVAFVENLLNGSLRLATAGAIAPGDAVCCHFEGLLLMGVVIYSNALGGIRIAGINLAHVLHESDSRTFSNFSGIT